MPIKMEIKSVTFDDSEDIKRVVERIDTRLKNFAKDYLEFSYRIEEYSDKLVVKTIMLGENVN